MSGLQKTITWFVVTLLVIAAVYYMVHALPLRWARLADKKKHAEVEAEKIHTYFDLLDQKPRREIVSLLSVKYGLQTNVTESILRGYTSEHGDEDWLGTNTMRVNLDFIGTINRLALSNGIPTQTVAAMLIDAKLLARSTGGNDDFGVSGEE